MTWAHWLTDARTGRIIRRIDIPSFSWELSVSDFGFSTTDKNLGEEDASSLSVPFSQFDIYDESGLLTHQSTPSEINSMLSIGRRALVSSWMFEGMPDPRGVPLWWGALGAPEDSWDATTFPLTSPMSLLAARAVIRDGAFHDGKSTDTVSYTGLSLRGIASELGSLVTEGKNGGSLPFDWTYRGEKGSHQRTDYKAWNVQNVFAKQLLTNIVNVQNGPDMAFRPYWKDDASCRVRFLAGSDADIYLDMDHEPIDLTCSPQGGSLEDVVIDYQHATQRIYATGAGTDESVVTALAEDMTEITGEQDPPILMESNWSDTDVTDVKQLKSKAMAVLNSNRRVMMQLSGTVHVNDLDGNGRPAHPLGSFWPGEIFTIHMRGHRRLPDDSYPMRLMKMSGDQSDAVKLQFDVVPAPF
jgi:hypothetical protein